MSQRQAAYLLIGDDDFPRDQAARELVDRLVPAQDQSFALEIVEGQADTQDVALASTKRCLEAVQTPAFLSSVPKAVWWRNVTWFADAATLGKETIQALIRDMVDLLQSGKLGGATLIVTAPAIDKRSSVYKSFAKHFEVREFMMPDKAYLVEKAGREKIVQAMKARNLSADEAAMQLMMGRLGADSRQIENEVEKLAVYLGEERRRVTEDDVRLMVAPGGNAVMWDLLDAVGDRALAKALKILQELLANKESGIGIVASLVGRMRDLALYREALDRGWVRVTRGSRGPAAEWGEVPPEVGAILSDGLKRDPRTAHPFVVSKMAQQAGRYSAAQLRRNLQWVLEAHEALVSSSIPERATLELLMVRLMS